MRKPKQLSSGKLSLSAINNELVVPVVCVTGTTKSESVVSHILEKYDVDTLTVSVNLEHQAKVLAKKGNANCEDYARELEEKLAAVLYNGFTVVGSNWEKHYGFFQKSASNGRNAELVFASVTRSKRETWPRAIWRQFWSLTSEIMGIEGMSLEDALGSVFLYSKALARMAAPGSSGVPIEHPLAVRYLKRCTVAFAEDLEGVNETPAKHPMSLENGKYTVTTSSRKTNKTDGTILFGPAVRLNFGLEFGSISVKEFTKGHNLLSMFRKTGKEKTWKKLLPILVKCPAFIQPRNQGSLKGGAVYADLDLYIKGRNENGEYRRNAPDVIIFDSAKKYKDDESNFRLDKWFICHVSSDDKGWVNMSAPVVSAIGANADVDIMKPIVDYWLHALEMMSSGNTIEKTKGIIDFLSATAPKRLDKENEEREMIIKALQANTMLAYDNHLTKKIVDKATSFVHRLISGKVPVPGAYPFIVVDPNALIKELVEKDILVARNNVTIPTLGRGEYYYNGNNCRGLIARSPLTHADQVKVVELKAHDDYKQYNNIFVMNATDGIWIDLSGADMDGDEVMLCLEKDQGHFKKEWITAIIEAVQSNKFDAVCFEEGKSGTPLSWNISTLIEYLVKTSTLSNVGVLSNSTMALMELKTHLLNLHKTARQMGCTAICMDPKFQYDNPLEAFKVEGHTLVTKGPLRKRERDARGKLIPVETETWSLDQVSFHADRSGKLCDNGSVIINREVDRDKTDIGATAEEITSLETNLLTFSSIARRYYKGEYTPGTAYFARKNPGAEKNVGTKKADEMAQEAAMKTANGDNAFYAYTPLGYMTQYTSHWWNNKKAMFQKWSRNLGGYCFSLLTNTEKVQVLELADKVHAMRIKYGEMVKSIKAESGDDDELKSLFLDELREDTKQQLKDFANANFLEYHVVAAMAYCDCHMGSTESDSAFAWLLADELLQVFARGDNRWMFQPLPKKMDTIDRDWVSTIRDGQVGFYDLLAPDVFKPVESAFRYYKQPVRETYNSKGRYGAFLKIVPERVGNINSCTAPTVNQYTINIGAIDDASPELIVHHIRQNNGVFKVQVLEDGRTAVTVNGHVIGLAYLNKVENLNLVNKNVIWDEDARTPVRCKDGSIAEVSWELQKHSIVRVTVCEL